MINWLLHHNWRSALIKLYCYLISIKMELNGISIQRGIENFLLCSSHGDARATENETALYQEQRNSI